MQRVSPGGGPLRNILLTIAYDGSRFHGWQIQQNAPSVQQAFQEALFQVIGNEFEIKGCSRTDSGVHANMYCLSVKTAHRIPAPRLKAALNRFLPRSIAVLGANEAPADFHARYSCKGKEYLYKIWNSETRNPFWRAMPCITVIRSMKRFYKRLRRRMLERTILRPSVRSISGKRAILHGQSGILPLCATAIWCSCA